jgi:hypothetical protein
MVMVTMVTTRRELNYDHIFISGGKNFKVTVTSVLRAAA